MTFRSSLQGSQTVPYSCQIPPHAFLTPNHVFPNYVNADKRLDDKAVKRGFINASSFPFCLT